MGSASKKHSPSEFFYDSSFKDYELVKIGKPFKKILKKAVADYRKFFLNAASIAAIIMSFLGGFGFAIAILIAMFSCFLYVFYNTYRNYK